MGNGSKTILWVIHFGGLEKENKATSSRIWVGVFFCWVLVLVCFSYWVPAVPTRSMAPGFTTYSHCTLTCNGIIRGFPSAGNRRRQSWFIESFQQNGSMEAGFPLDAIFLCIDESGPLSFVITVHKDYCLKLLILSKIVLPIINLWN